ncbi:MAG: hypothetical protein ACTS73_06550 [Arsenophonus sp. NEOnobi-MAG3]
MYKNTNFNTLFACKLQHGAGVCAGAKTERLVAASYCWEKAKEDRAY